MTAYVSQTQYGKNEDFGLQVARGQIQGHRGIRINAYNLSVSSIRTTIWPKTTEYEYPASASTMVLYSTVVEDTTQAILVQGLNASYNEIQETVVLNGQTGATTVNSYFRINSMRVVSGNPTGSISLGTGDAVLGVPANTYGFILAGDGISLSSVWTVPAGHTLYVKSNTLVTGALAATHSVVVGYRARTLTGTNILLGKVAQGNGSIVMPITPSVGIPEKTDITANGQTSTGTCTVSVMLSAILIKNSTGY